MRCYNVQCHNNHSTNELGGESCSAAPQGRLTRSCHVMPQARKTPEDHASAPDGLPDGTDGTDGTLCCTVCCTKVSKDVQGQGRPVSVAPTPSISRECAGRKSLIGAMSKISLHPSFFSGYQEAGIATDLLQQISSFSSFRSKFRLQIKSIYNDHQ